MGLAEMFRLYPMVLTQSFPPARVYDLFNPEFDDSNAAAFLHQLLCFKASQGLSVREEVSKVGKLLLRRSKQQSLRHVPASPLRLWLSRIWRDVPESQDRATVTECCVRWIGDDRASLADKFPCLAVVKHEVEERGYPDGDTWLLSKLLAQVCRDPVGHSPDLQHFLWLLGASPTAGMVRPLLEMLVEEPGRLVTLWLCLCLWVPQPHPPELGPSKVPPVPPPIHGLLRTALIVFSQLSSGEDVCRTCLLSVAAIAARGVGVLAAVSAELLLFLHREGPVLGEVWMPVTPVLETTPSPKPCVVELLQRLRVSRP